MTDGDYTVELLGYNNGYMSIRLMSQNIYTTQFATKAELNTSISQTANEINLRVDEKLDEEDFSSANILLKINNDESSATINADKINLNGAITANNLFKINTDGSMEATNGKFTGGKIELTDNGGTTNANMSLYSTDYKHLITSTSDVISRRLSSGVGGEALVGSSIYRGETNSAIWFLDNRPIGGNTNIYIEEGYARFNISNFNITGNLTVTGTKNRAVQVNDGKTVLLNAYETTTPYFGDIGSNKTNQDGYCKIYIDKLFKETIDLENYKVFIQECGEGHLFVNKEQKYFEVIGTPNLQFDWELKAVQKGFKNIRLQEMKGGKENVN